MSEPTGTRWLGKDGTPVSCREKLRTLEENDAEIRQVLQDAFEDAVLMGVDEGVIRQAMLNAVQDLTPPGRR